MDSSDVIDGQKTMGFVSDLFEQVSAPKEIWYKVIPLAGVNGALSQYQLTRRTT